MSNHSVNGCEILPNTFLVWLMQKGCAVTHRWGFSSKYDTIMHTSTPFCWGLSHTTVGPSSIGDNESSSPVPDVLDRYSASGAWRGTVGPDGWAVLASRVIPVTSETDLNIASIAAAFASWRSGFFVRSTSVKIVSLGRSNLMNGCCSTRQNRYVL